VKLGFDHVLSGDGEEMLPVLLWNIYEEHVAGDGHVKSDGAASRQTILLSKIHRPPPLTTLDSSFPIDPIHGLTAPLELTRGCRWRCTFCQTGSLRTRPVSRSLDSVKEYALELKRRNFTRINFISPTALEYGSASPEAPSPDCVASVLETSRNYGMTRIEFGIFPTEIRPESLSPLMAKILKTYCSHRHLTIGAQSGCSTMLKKLKRGHTLNHVEHAAANALNAGFLPMIDIILGAPDETYEHRFATLKWMKTMNRLVRAMFQVHYFLPLAGSESWGKLPSPLENDIQTELIKMQTAGFVKGFWQADILLYKKLESYLLNQSDSDSE
jgi:radical SAM superfamily enzyme YgiQ (UPF0313 family)